ncbi:MAG: FAD-dependent oxidoreductase [Eikenella sp.]|nr:FAD-dependent oxidoreductase [Eikenella sp.]
MNSIAVVGGGLAGRLIALQLVRNGCRVSLYEQGPRSGAGAAAYVAAAMLAPLSEAAEATPEVAALGRQSLPLWRALLPTLPEPVFMQENGSLMVWHAQDKALADRFVRRLQRAHAGGMPLQPWRAGEMAAQEPLLAGRFAEGLFLPGEGQLDNRQVLSALAAALEAEGAACHWQTAAEPAQLKNADYCVDCRGIGAKAAWHAVAGSRLRGVRGEVARVYAPEVSLRRPVRLLHPRYPLYIAPKQNHLFVVGATQLESESTAPVSVRSSLELMSALYAVSPAFGEAQIVELAAKLRPTLNHHNPEIRYRPAGRLVEVNGLFRHGFMIAPAVSAAAVRLVLALAGGGAVPAGDAESGLPYLVQA